MADFATVRAEIKQWEREFRTAQGAEPTIVDIKARPDIAQKYKLYKKLSKASASQPNGSSSKTPQPPSTPTRKHKQSAAIPLSAKRIIASTGPLSTFNPFSPQKDKRKETFTPTLRTQKPPPNPFASPVKNKRPIEQPSFLPVVPPISHERSGSPGPSNTISRARKRLRGEQVSPSPNKDKRRRRNSGETLRPLPKLAFNLAESDGEDEESAFAANSSFVDDSPMKLTTSARSFTALFEENTAPSADIFGLNKQPNPSRQDSASSSKTVGGSSRSHDLPTRVFKSASSKNKIFPKKPDPKQPTLTEFLAGPRKPLPSSETSRGNSEEARSIPSSATTPPVGDELEDTTPPKSPLLPPSPPPETSSYKGKGKRKADPKSRNSKKKVKMAVDEHSDEDTESDLERTTKVKVITRARVVDTGSDDDRGSEFDRGLPYPQPGSRHESPETQEHHTTAMIDLPDKLRNVLAFNMSDTKATDLEAEKVFQSLVYRRRVSHFDPKKGEIWDVGEDEEDGGRDGDPNGDDDEWQGEPVPWELAEL